MDRRSFLRAGFVGCSLAASPFVTPISLAATPADARLVVIVLRGGMDGLASVAPYGDPAFSMLRGELPLGAKGYQDLDGFFALHPALDPLMPLWRKGELGVVHATSTPYRDKRSHFDGQDLLEAGLADLSSGLSRDGWLNRLVAQIPGATTETAYAVGRDPMMILDGDAPVSRWTPEADLALSPQAIRLAELIMQGDPLMAPALASAFRLADSDGDALSFVGQAGDMMAMMQADRQAATHGRASTDIARFAAERLRADTRIAAFSINGFDSHANQDRVLSRALQALSDAVLTLHETVGPRIWGNTAVLAMTEFGRTARINGTKGTDHGTGGTMLVAGGAVRGGRVIGRWPGLTDADLYQARDLMPTRDLRAYTAWVLRGLFGLPADVVAREVFPRLDLGADPKVLL